MGIEKKCILIIVQRDATQSSLFIILQVHFYMFPVSTTPIIRSTQNCNYSLRYCAATCLQRVAKVVWPRWIDHVCMFTQAQRT